MTLKFGNISSEDLRLLIDLFPTLEKEVAEARQIAVTDRGEIFAADCIKASWSHLYETPFHEQLGRMLGGLDLAVQVNEAMRAPSEIQALVGIMEQVAAEFDAAIATQEEKEASRPGAAAFLGIVFSVYHSLRCLLVSGHYLNDLIRIVRTGGKDAEKALFVAVKIDPTVIGCPAVLARVSQATIENDKVFLRKLQLALGGKLAKREQRNYQLMRMVLQALIESGAGRLSNEQLHELFVKEVGLYADTAEGDARKALRKFADNYKSI